MSERTFVRRFRATTGMAPGDWMRRQRMEHAKELLERSSLTIDQVAAQSGLGTAMTMRHHFRSTTERVKRPVHDAGTISSIGTCALSLPETPLTVSAYFPGLADVGTKMISSVPLAELFGTKA